MADKQELLFMAGKPVPDFHEVHEHVSPMKTYWAVFIGLLFLTAVTYGVSYANLGAASLFVAMVVAVIKATLVCMYFMHLKYDDRYHVFVFTSTILFVAIFFTFTIFDLKSRDKLMDEQETFFKQYYDDASPTVQPPPSLRVPVEHGAGHDEGGEHAEAGGGH